MDTAFIIPIGLLMVFGILWIMTATGVGDFLIELLDRRAIANRLRKRRRLIEKTAALAHTQWSGWMVYMFRISERRPDGTIVIPKGSVERWTRQMNTSYSDLPESEKESDRREAEEYMKVFRKYWINEE